MDSEVKVLRALQKEDEEYKNKCCEFRNKKVQLRNDEREFMRKYKMETTRLKKILEDKPWIFNTEEDSDNSEN